jgi:hypothetical protein
MCWAENDGAFELVQNITKIGKNSMTDSDLRDFDAFVERQQVSKSEEKPVDWAAERDRWLNDLKELYSKIELFLANYINSGEITLEYRDLGLKTSGRT